MNTLLTIKGCKEIIKFIKSKMHELVPNGTYEEFEEEELIMIATRLDEVMELIGEVRDKVSAIEQQITTVEGSLSTIESAMENKSDITHTHDEIALSHTRIDSLDSKLKSIAEKSDLYRIEVAVNHPSCISYKIEPEYVKSGESQTLSYEMAPGYHMCVVDITQTNIDGSTRHNAFNDTEAYNNTEITTRKQSITMYGPAKIILEPRSSGGSGSSGGSSGAN